MFMKQRAGLCLFFIFTVWILQKSFFEARDELFLDVFISLFVLEFSLVGIVFSGSFLRRISRAERMR